MIAFLMRRKRPPLKYIISEIVIAMFAMFVIGPIAWMAFDRNPPWWRLHGTVEPYRVHRGERITATYTASPLTRYCPGKVQREVIDVQRNLWPKLSASTVASWEQDHDAVTGTVITPGVIIPPSAAYGSAVYRVTTFWYCNPLQRWLDWPIVQVGPDLPFEIIP